VLSNRRASNLLTKMGVAPACVSGNAHEESRCRGNKDRRKMHVAVASSPWQIAAHRGWPHRELPTHKVHPRRVAY